MLSALEKRLDELREKLEKLDSGSLEHLQMQTYILGFVEACQIAYKAYEKGKKC
jgi:hypothetical protein